MSNDRLEQEQAERIHKVIRNKVDELNKSRSKGNELSGRQLSKISSIIHGKGVSEGSFSKALNDNLEAGANSFSRETWRKLGDICDMSPFQVDNFIDGIIGPFNFTMAITGPSCAGKSYLTEAIKEVMGGKVCNLGLDNFYRDRDSVEQLRYRFDDPKSSDKKAAYKALLGLKRGQRATIPKYNRETYKAEGEVSLSSAKVILVEGIFCCSTQELRSCYDFTVWVDSRASKRAVRRFARDEKDLGRVREEYTSSYINEVEASYEEHLLPLRTQHADIVINNEKDFVFKKGSTKSTDLPIGVQVILKYLTSI